jgi:hypothetical protein
VILVLADDLSGAAELGAVAREHGLSAEIQTAFDPSATADVLLVELDTRLATAEEAAARVVSTLGALPRRPGWIYLKVDSVLRGPVASLIRSALAATGLPRALLIAANPTRGRVIRAGRYAIDGIPLHQTRFARDPDHPATSDAVSERLGGPREVILLRPDDPLPARGIAVPDVSTFAEVLDWAGRWDRSTLPVGAADFFRALLGATGLRMSGGRAPCRVEASNELGTVLLVCGSKTAWEQGRADQLQTRGVPVVPMPSPAGGAEAFASPGPWSDVVVSALERAGSALVALGTPPHDASPRQLEICLARCVASVLGRTRVDRLYLEGGATAGAVGRVMGWRRFEVIGVLGSGLPLLRVASDPGPTLAIKPGSYDWPDEAWPRRCV